MTIFVSIAAYRDPELNPTLADCIAKARAPQALHFGIVWQHGPDEPAPIAEGAGRLRVADVPWQESRGACWARAEAMALYDGEDFYLQLDSHHRFAEGWDAILIEQARATGAAKPLLTTYATAYDPALPPPAGHPSAMRFDRFTPEGIPLFQAVPIPVGRPQRARFVSGHLLFAPGRFVADVPYDPELYFIGEEISLAVRAFTHGYDLFHPGAHVVWHEYSRKLRTKHWDDHRTENGVATAWHTRDAASLAKVRQLLTAPETGPFGCGTARGFAQYEAYAGITFRRLFASRDARRGAEPPPPIDAAPGRDWQVRLAIGHDRFAPAALDSPLFWYVGFHDAEGVEIARADADCGEMSRALAAKSGPIVIERRFVSPRAPARWTIWPADRKGRWLDRIEGAIEPPADPAMPIAVTL